MRDWQKKVAAWTASAAMVALPVVVALYLAGCTTQAQARPGPDLEAAGAAILAQDKKQIDGMSQGLQMCMGGVQEMLVLCPKVPKNAPFEDGIKQCVKEAQANQKGAVSSSDATPKK